MNLKIHLKQNKTRGGTKLVGKNFLGTFLNPLTYLFGRGRVPGEVREGLITGLVSLISHCLPSTFTVMVFWPHQGGTGGRGGERREDLAPQSRWWQRRRKSCVRLVVATEQAPPDVGGQSTSGNEVHD